MMLTEVPKSAVAQLIEQDVPPMNDAGPELVIDQDLLRHFAACSDYGVRLLKRLGGPSGTISGRWSASLALWLARQEPDAASWLRTTLGLGVAGQGKDLRGVNLVRANLRSACLSGADLSGAYLWQANLEGASLENANLSQAHAEEVLLWRASLEGANLSYCVLQGARLDGSFLRSANLEGASLWGANLEGAHLEGANLKETVLNGTNLEGAWREAQDPPVPGWRVVEGRLRA